MYKKKDLFPLLCGILALFLFSVNGIYAQDNPDQQDQQFTEPEFTVIQQVKTTPVKSQGGTGTCWCFATTSMLESEMMRLGKPETGLSEMFTVRTMYNDKAEQYVRFHGTCNFAQGGAQHDVLSAVKKYGMVPRESYQGLNYGTEQHNHGEIETVLKGVVENVTKNKNGVLSPVWLNALNTVLDAYFGELPATFEYKGKEYTPQSFAAQSGINPDDYIEFSSYLHHPFYEQFVLEVPDNWAQKYMYNIPIDELMSIIDQALEMGISISWAADVSGLNFNQGVALIPAEGENPKNRMAKEKEITQQDRQYMFDSYQLTDDHAMHLVGTAKDQNGKKYYIEKNSWGPGGKYKGFSYMSEAFMRLRTMSIMVHKDAVPAELAKKLGIQ